MINWDVQLYMEESVNYKMNQVDWSTFIKETIFPPNDKRTISEEDLVVCDCTLGKGKACIFKCIPYLAELREGIKNVLSVVVYY